MAGFVGPEIPGVTDGLVFYVDAALTYTSGSTTWYDEINGNNGILTNGPTYSTDGRGSIILDGTNDYIESSLNIGISGSNPRTQECWIYVSEAANKNIMGGGGNGAANLFDTIIWSSGGYLRVVGHYYSSGYDTISTLPSRNTININQWNNIVHLYDGSNVSLYTNGVFSNSKTLTLNTNNNRIRLGAGFYSNYNYFEGKGSIMKVYNRALSSTEVLQNYNALKSRFNL